MDANLTADLAEYLNGTLNERERQKVQAILDADPAVRDELAILAFIKRAVKESVPEVSPDRGLEKTLALNRSVSAGTSKAAGSAATPTSAPASATTAGTTPGAMLSQRLRDVAQWLFRPPLAFAVMAIFLVTQAGVIFHLMTERPDEFVETRARTNAPAPVGPFIKISLRPEARESDIRFLLTSLGASIVGGPTQLGDYYLFVEASRTDWAARQLRQSPIVENANVIATLPAAKE